MEKEQILFTDLSQIAVNRQDICSDTTEIYWRSMQYTAGKIEGRLLLAGELTTPKELTLAPELSGWYKIYIGDINLSMGSEQGGYSTSRNKLYIRLDNQATFSVIDGDGLPKPIYWKPYECAEERFWMAADMTGRNIILHKPVLNPNWGSAISCIAWLRFEPMSEKEIGEYRDYTTPRKAMHIHFDSDEDLVEEQTDLGALCRLARLDEVDAEICSYEFVNTDPFEQTNECRTYKNGNAKLNRFEQRVGHAIEALHNADIKALAAFRMSLANFGMPTGTCLPIAFVRDNPQFYCLDRLGNTVKICSYAYKEVQDYTIAQFKAALQYGFDGISMLFHRGNFIGFEQPVLNRFALRYPGIDPRRLPVTDERLHGIWCEIMTEFITRLKQELNEYAGKKLIFHAVLETTPVSAKNFGIDIEEWARLGLLDSFCNETMETAEDLTGCIAEDGLIDLAAYREALTRRPVIVRDFNNTVLEKALEGAKAYQKIADKYHIDFYGVILNNPFCRRYTESRNKMLKLGVRKFSFFNYTHIVSDLTQFHIVSKLGHDTVKEAPAKPEFFRTISLDDRYFGTFEPNWRG